MNDVVARILGAAKYRDLDPGFVARIVAEASPGRSPREAEQEARRRLHQAVGAFGGRSPAAVVDRARREVEADPAAAPDAWRRAMGAHRSTAERAAHLEDLAVLLERWCGRPRSVLDLAGGLGALAAPWLALAPGATYTCVDVDTALAAALGRAGPLLGVELVAVVRDLAADPPTATAELGLLLKALPTLDAQRPGATAALLGRITCDHLVVSLPRRSLGGRRRYAEDPVARVAAAVDGTGYAVADDDRVGDEHHVLCRPEGAGAGHR